MALDRRAGAGANQEVVRRHNLGTLLGHVHHSEHVSRAELTARMQLNRSTIAALVGGLESLGVVEQVTPQGQRTGAGRPSLEVRPGRHEVFVVAVELRVDRISVARVGLGGHVLDRASEPLTVEHDPEHVADALAGLCGKVVAPAPPSSRLVGLGIGLPGVVGTDDGLIRFAPNLGWTDTAFTELVQDRIGGLVDVRLGNDADLGVLSEHTRGAAAGCDNVVYLSGDVGVGGGVIAAGRALGGAGGYAGEIGHMRVNPRGRTCRCGSRGCWETEIGAQSIATALRTSDIDFEVLASRLHEVRRPSVALRAVGRQIGVGLGNLINIFNPEVVILGGLLRDLYPVVKDDVDEAMRAGALVASVQQSSVVLPALGADSVLLGAAELAFAPLLEDPVKVLSDSDGAVRELLDRAG
ncbi:MAG: ROK family protein [Nocardioidaceae bacterium]